MNKHFEMRITAKEHASKLGLLRVSKTKLEIENIPLAHQVRVTISWL